MRIAIIVSGKVGLATLRRLGTEGGHQLVGIARRVPETRPDGADGDWVSADLTRGTRNGTLEPAFTGGNAVVHLAWDCNRLTTSGTSKSVVVCRRRAAARTRPPPDGSWTSTSVPATTSPTPSPASSSEGGRRRQPGG